MRRILVVALMLMAFPALAQDDVSAGKVSQVTMEISQEIYSPFCPGKTLAMCPSPAAAEVRRDIQTMAEKGLDKESIKKNVIKEYGEEFRLEEPPLTDNLGLLALIFLGLGLAGTAVWFISKRRSTGPETDETGGTPSEPADGTDGESEDRYLDELREQYRD